jgi:hypothetical protein
MPQPSDSQKSQLSSHSNATPVKTVSVPVEQATIGRSLVIKGEVSGNESLYIDGRIEGAVNFAGHRVTIGSNGSAAALNSSNVTRHNVTASGKPRHKPTSGYESERFQLSVAGSGMPGRSSAG